MHKIILPVLFSIVTLTSSCGKSKASVKVNTNDSTEVLPDEEPCSVTFKNVILLKDSDFVIPQVEFSDKAIQDTINAALSAEGLTGRTMEELEKEKREFKDQMMPGGLGSIDYIIHKNSDCVMSISILRQECYAYCTGYSKDIQYDLKTGRVIKITDILKPETMDKLVAICDAQLQRNIEKTKKENSDDEDLEGMYDGHRFTKPNLENFIFTENGLAFGYEFDFPHVILAAQPDGSIEINKKDLEPFLIKHQYGL